MKLALMMLISAVILTGGWRYAAAQAPISTARSAEVKDSYVRVFRSLKGYLSSSGTHYFELVSADEKKGELVGKRHGIDQLSWSEIAYCSVGPMNLLDVLKDGSVVVNIKLDREAAHLTNVTVNATVTGLYGLGDSSHQVNCQSKGVIESEILAAAGAREPRPTPQPQ